MCQGRRSARSPRRFAWFRSFCPVFSKLEMTKSYMFFSYSRMLVFSCSLLPCFGVAQIHECMPHTPPLQSSSLVHVHRSFCIKWWKDFISKRGAESSQMLWKNSWKLSFLSKARDTPEKTLPKVCQVTLGGVISVVTVFQQQDMDCILLSHHFQWI